jgi:hypothetical protein
MSIASSCNQLSLLQEKCNQVAVITGVDNRERKNVMTGNTSSKLADYFERFIPFVPLFDFLALNKVFAPPNN